MINRYFNIVHKFRLNIGNPISRYMEYRKVSRYLDKFSLSYDDLIEVIKFIKILETSFFYPNKKNSVYYKDYQCPIIIDVSKPMTQSISILGNPILGVDKSRIETKITLYDECGVKYIQIQILDADSKKPLTNIKFEDGTYEIRECFEEHLFMSIVDNLSIHVKKLLEVYCYKLIHQ